MKRSASKPMGTCCIFFVAALFLLAPVLAQGESTWMEQGFRFLQTRQFREAVGAFTQAIEAEPGRAEAYNQRGVARANTGDADGAITDYTEAIRIKPELAGAYNNRGSVLYQKGDYDRAISDYTEALRINPYLAEVYCNRGVAWTGKGDYFHAIQDFTQSLETNPYFDAAYFNRGKALSTIGDCEQAVADLNRAVDLNPAFDDAYHQLAVLLVECPDPRFRDAVRAMQMAEKAVALNPTPSRLDTLASAHAAAGRFRTAVSIQEQAVAAQKVAGETEHRIAFSERLARYRSRLDAEAKALSGSTARPARGAGTTATPVRTYSVQVGAFLSRENASKRQAYLRERGYDAAIISFSDRKGRAWHTVRVGPYPDRNTAQQSAADLSAKETFQTSVRPSDRL